MSKKPRRNGSTGKAGSGSSNGDQTAAIRDYLKSHKGARPKQVAAALRAQGVKVSPNRVSIIRAKAGVKKASRQAKQAVAAQEATAGVKMNQAQALEAALTLYKAARGMETEGSKIRKAFLLLIEILG